MANAHTVHVVSGDVTELKDFMLDVIKYRTEGVNLSIDEAGQVVTAVYDEDTPAWYKARADRDAKEVEDLLQMSPEEADRIAQASYDRRKIEYDLWLNEKTLLRARVEAMISKVNAWKPPSPQHDWVKADMLQQLRETLSGLNPNFLREPVLQTGAEYLRTKIDSARRSRDSYMEEYNGALESQTPGMAWAKQLINSLPVPTLTPSEI